MKKVVLFLLILLVIPLALTQEKCEWRECREIWAVDPIASGEISPLEIQECVSVEGKVIETKECDLKKTILTKTISKCYEKYLEIYDSNTNELVIGIKEQTNYETLDLEVEISEGGYCNYCSDGVFNYDEIKTDCGGEYCPDVSTDPDCVSDEEGSFISKVGVIEINEFENIQDIIYQWKNSELSLKSAVNSLYNYFS